MTTAASMTRGLVAWAMILGVPLATWHIAVRTLHYAADVTWAVWSPEQVVVIAIGSMGVAIGGYLTAATALLGFARLVPLPGQLLATLVPHAWRKVAATAIGMSLTTGVAAPAMASDADSALVSAGWISAPAANGAEASPESSPGALNEKPTPDHEDSPTAWDVSTPNELPPAPVDDDTSSHTSVDKDGVLASTLGPGEDYTVQRGDSLWRIATQILGPDATDAEVAAAWPALYRANQDAIGDNPSLIRPGQVLTIPQEVSA